MVEINVKLPSDYLKVPERLNIATHAVDRHLKEGRGDRPAIYFGQEVITFRKLYELENRFGNALKELGLGPNSCFIIRSWNCPEYIIAVLGGLKVGAIPIPTNSLFRSWELEHIINNSGTVAAITTPELIGPIEEVRDRCKSLKHMIIIGEAKKGYLSFEDLLKRGSPELTGADTHKDDLAFMVYTSGTAGEPKGVEHAHRWYIATGDPIAKVLMQLTQEDICFQPQEISFIYPLGNNVLYPFLVGASIVLYPGRFDAEKCFEYIQKYKVTVLSAVPTIFRMMLAVPDAEKRYDLSTVRHAISGGEPLPQDTYEEAKRRFGFEICDNFGQSEIHIFMANFPGMKIKPGSMGVPLPGHIVAVMDEDGKECPPGKIGELVIREDNPGLCIGYRGSPDRWAVVHRGGWYYCKDYAYKDEDGYYWYVSRSDDLIKSRAYLISPKEVEAATMEHPAVLEAGVVGVPDPMIGQRVKAYIVLKGNYKASEELKEEIRAKVSQIIAPFKTPREIEFVKELPKTATGKILRRELRKISLEDVKQG